MLDEYPSEWHRSPIVFQSYLADKCCDLCGIRDGTVRERPCEMELCNDCAQKLKQKGAKR